MGALPPVDHLVWGCRDLRGGVDELTRRLGVRAAPGGRHPGRGTHNALIGLGGGAYLEVIAPDPEQSPPPQLPFGLEGLTEAGLVAWAIGTSDIAAQVQRARSAGYEPGRILRMSRDLPDGGRLRWRLTEARDAVIPFVIDWGDTPHPSASASPGVRLVSLSARHPDPEGVRLQLAALGAPIAVAFGSRSALSAVLETPAGTVELD